jgi:two-component system, cell cycle response regulator DivK
MDGLTFAQQLKQDPLTRDIPIIVVTAFPNLWSRWAAMGVGCNVYLVKPVENRTLCQQVADIVAPISDAEATP